MSKSKEILTLAKSIEEARPSKDLENILKDKEKPSAYWPNITYQGNDLFEITNKALATFSKKLHIGDKYDQVGYYDNGEEYEYEAELDGQEVYLGYVPSKDKFISCYDMFMYHDAGAGDSGVGIIEFIIKSGKVKILKVDDTSDRDHGLFYNNKNRAADYTLEKLHKKYKDLVDIRLD